MKLHIATRISSVTTKNGKKSVISAIQFRMSQSNYVFNLIYKNALPYKTYVNFLHVIWYRPQKNTLSTMSEE